jgi:hypothetical protein
MFCPNDECPDFVNSGLRSEYRDDVMTCPFCGSAMVAARPESPFPEVEGIIEKPPVADDEAMEPIIEATDLTEVAIIKSILEGAQVPFITQGENPFSAFRGAFAGGSIFNPRARGVVFTVPERMADEARALLEELVESAEDSAEED